MKKRKRGGQPKITTFIVQRMEEAASVDSSIAELCFHADISKQTYYNWIKKDKHLFDRLEALREKPCLQARLTICKAMRDGNADTSLKYLERKRKSEFSPRSEVTGPDGAPLPVPTVHVYLPHNSRDPIPPAPAKPAPKGDKAG